MREREASRSSPPVVPNSCQIQRRPTGHSGESRGHRSSLPNEHPDLSSQVRGCFCWVAGQGFEPWTASADGFTGRVRRRLTSIRHGDSPPRLFSAPWRRVVGHRMPYMPGVAPRAMTHRSSPARAPRKDREVAHEEGGTLTSRFISHAGTWFTRPVHGLGRAHRDSPGQRRGWWPRSGCGGGPRPGLDVDG
jgi:hypothetical protein